MNSSRHIPRLFLLALLAFPRLAPATDYNLRIVTDASPDYTDMAGLVRSVTANWPTTREKCWAMFYWNHLARRQTNPMCVRGDKLELTDPIRQFNDYGFTQCSTISGINTSIWGNMGLPVRFWDITLHTVPEVFYDGCWHMYDDSLSALYTLCDGVTLAGVEDIGKTLACPASGGRAEPGHIARYHCLTATSANGFLTGADTPRSLIDEGEKIFNPKGLKFRDYTNNWDWGHRYILNLRENEIYTRFYHRLDGQGAAPGAKSAFASDPAYYIPNPATRPGGKDPEAANPRYHLRGNGTWTFKPLLTPAAYRNFLFSARGIAAAAPAGLQPEKPGAPAEAIYRVESANVTTSQQVKAAFFRRSAADSIRLSVSTDNGLTWQAVWTAQATGDVTAGLSLVREVSGAYEPLLKVELLGAAAASDAVLKDLEIQTVTELNAKTQPKLRLGKNTIFVGAGAPTDSIVLWPDLRAGQYKKEIVEEANIAATEQPSGYLGVLHPARGNEDAWVVYRIDAPGDIASLTYGGRFYNRSANGKTGCLRLYHSTDGRAWTQSWALENNNKPWDVVHYETVALPQNSRAVWVKVLLRTPNVQETGAGVGVMSLRMEADYAPAPSSPADPAFKPLEVAFTWREVQPDHSTVQRSHTQLVERVPFTYTLNVGGDDHPVMESLRANLAGAAGAVRYGYSDGRDAGGEKIRDRWVTYGRNLAEGKKYTVSVPSGTQWGAGDPAGTRLTDGVVGANYAGGATVALAALWNKGQHPDITVDLEKPETCGAFRIHLAAGWPWWDALKGEVRDKVEVLTSTDGKAYQSQGLFNLNLRRRDLPVNFMLADDETAQGWNFELIPPRPVQARYVRYLLTPERSVTVSEVQVLDSIRYEPFDLRLALPEVQ